MRSSLPLYNSVIRSYFTIIALGLGLVHCNEAPLPSEAGAEAGASCDARKNGAVLQIQINDQTFRFWSTNAEFIARAKDLNASGKSSAAMFGKLIDGSDCDTQWTFHVDAGKMSWPDVTTEVCDGRPSDIEGNKAHWINDITRWCPWNTKVLAVDERR
jgi:hypothetical protein